MNSAALDALLRPARFTNWVIWATLTLSIGIYAGVAFMLSQRSDPKEVSEAFQIGLACAAIIVGGISIAAPRFLLTDERLMNFMNVSPTAETLPTHPKLGVLDDQRIEQMGRLSPQERKLVALPGLYFTPFILRLVLNEAVTIFGLVLSLVSGRFEPVLPFAIAAVALNLAMRPRFEPLLERARRLDRTS